MKSSSGKKIETRGYAPVNGLKMYYEIEGTGDPLVYIPPVFGFVGLTTFPALVQSHSVITVDLQGHGRTADIPERPIILEQSAKDVVGIALGDHDFVCLEHALETFKRIPNAELAVIPDASHFVLFSEQERVIPVVKHFLEKPAKRYPLATAEMGYHPGETR